MSSSSSPMNWANTWFWCLVCLTLWMTLVPYKFESHTCDISLSSTWSSLQSCFHIIVQFDVWWCILREEDFAVWKRPGYCELRWHYAFLTLYSTAYTPMSWSLYIFPVYRVRRMFFDTTTTYIRWLVFLDSLFLHQLSCVCIGTSL